MITFLPSPRWVQTPLGQGLWIAILDYGISHNPIYLVEICSSGEHRNIDMREIRGLENHTFDIERPLQPTERDPKI
jgi:hypothetical protein